ncbi:MAG TPA: ubiquinol-cytochrome c reductase iron-sulfur subunit [Gaiellaceae bacterium]|nr:ubiquinol-cytochrome c reductase iron-sulfur subunit [Gaiellaceae bacterium]
MDSSRGHDHTPGPSLWPVGFAVGVVVMLVGFVVSWAIVAVGIFVTVFFAFLWLRELIHGRALAGEPPAVQPEQRPPRAAAVPRPARTDLVHDRYPRNVFLEASTLGLGAVIGGLVTLPVLGFMIGPAFLKQGVKLSDLGPITDFPEGQFLITTFTSNAQEGTVSRRTAFVRNNGFLGTQPSFTVISNHCAHLGCPVEPNGVPLYKETKRFRDVTMIPVLPSGFGCPCHGGQYDTEGNRIAGPPVRGLDRYAFSIVNGHLMVGKPFSVAYVVGTGANAQIHATRLSFPGEHVSGIESWLYPIQPPH